VHIKFKIVLDPIKLIPVLKILSYFAVEFYCNFLNKSNHTSSRSCQCWGG